MSTTLTTNSMRSAALPSDVNVLIPRPPVFLASSFIRFTSSACLRAALSAFHFASVSAVTGVPPVGPSFARCCSIISSMEISSTFLFFSASRSAFDLNTYPGGSAWRYLQSIGIR